MKLYLFGFNKRGYLKLFHVHSGFTDRCLFWYSYGKLMDLFFIKIIP